jgi:hypothetical protein
MAPSLGADINGPGTIIENRVRTDESNNVVNDEAGVLSANEEALATLLFAGKITVIAEVTAEYLLKYPAVPTPAPSPAG